MGLHVVVGAGPTGVSTARFLAEEGEEVRLVSRRGSGPELEGVTLVAADALDAETMRAVARGASTVVNSAMPPYDTWPELFPPINTALLDLAAQAGARYALVSNVYAYGPVDGPISEDLPPRPTTIKGRVRAAMWQEALAAHAAGRVEVVEVRGSDYLGAGAFSIFSITVAEPLLRRTAAVAPADLAAPHTWTTTDDVGHLLVALVGRDDGWGRVWNVPSNPPVSFADLAKRLAQLTNIESYTLDAMTPLALAEAARADTIAAEFPEMQYLFQRPFVLDSSAAERELGIAPTSLDDALVAMADAILATA